MLTMASTCAPTPGSAPKVNPTRFSQSMESMTSPPAVVKDQDVLQPLGGLTSSSWVLITLIFMPISEAFSERVSKSLPIYCSNCASVLLTVKCFDALLTEALLKRVVSSTYRKAEVPIIPRS